MKFPCIRSTSHFTHRKEHLVSIRARARGARGGCRLTDCAGAAQYQTGCLLQREDSEKGGRVSYRSCQSTAKLNAASKFDPYRRSRLPKHSECLLIETGLTGPPWPVIRYVPARNDSLRIMRTRRTFVYVLSKFFPFFPCKFRLNFL